QRAHNVVNGSTRARVPRGDEQRWRIPENEGGRVVLSDDVRTVPAFDDVTPAAAKQQVVADAARDDVITRTGNNYVVPVPCINGVVPRRTVITNNYTVCVLDDSDHDDVVAIPRVDDIVAARHADDIWAGGRGDDVRAICAVADDARAVAVPAWGIVARTESAERAVPVT